MSSLAITLEWAGPGMAPPCTLVTLSARTDKSESPALQDLARERRSSTWFRVSVPVEACGTYHGNVRARYGREAMVDWNGMDKTVASTTILHRHYNTLDDHAH